jgi:aminoglycoside 6'-N-acetyltransferase
LLAIRATEQVQRRWRGDDLSREFDENLDDDEVVQLTIETHDGETVGMVQFGEEDDPDYRHASLDIYIDPAAHRRGYASDAIRTLVDHLFDDRGHHRLTIDPAADNTPAITCYASVGFRTVGRVRSYERQPDGTWADGLLMEMLATDREQDDRAIELDAVVAAELTLLDPTTRCDRSALDALLNSDFVEIGASGRRRTRNEIVDELVASPDPGELDVEEMEARWVTSNAVVLTYRTVSPRRTVLRSSWWLWTDGRWQIVFHQGTPTNP